MKAACSFRGSPTRGRSMSSPGPSLRATRAPTSAVSRSARRARPGLTLVLAVAAGGCSGQIASDPGRPGAGGGRPGVGGGSSQPGGSGPGGSGPGGMAEPGGPSLPAPPAAPAVGHRLTDRQYSNVLLDVLGVDVSAQVANLPLDPKLEGFR